MCSHQRYRRACIGARATFTGRGLLAGSAGVKLADIDLGLRLRAAGYGCVHEDRFVVATMSEPPGETLSFAGGRAAERLFWRHAAASHWTSVLLTHSFTWLAECITCNVHRPQIVWQIAGRIAGCLERGFRRRQAARGLDLTARCEADHSQVLSSGETSDAEYGSTFNFRAAAGPPRRHGERSVQTSANRETSNCSAAIRLGWMGQATGESQAALNDSANPDPIPNLRLSDASHLRLRCS